jgi:hypothetical protein
MIVAVVQLRQSNSHDGNFPFTEAALSTSLTAGGLPMCLNFGVNLHGTSEIQRHGQPPD